MRPVRKSADKSANEGAFGREIKMYWITVTNGHRYDQGMVADRKVNAK
jgi:hypothetical protein